MVPQKIFSVSSSELCWAEQTKEMSGLYALSGISLEPCIRKPNFQFYLTFSFKIWELWQSYDCLKLCILQFLLDCIILQNQYCSGACRIFGGRRGRVGEKGDHYIISNFSRKCRPKFAIFLYFRGPPQAREGVGSPSKVFCGCWIVSCGVISSYMISF